MGQFAMVFLKIFNQINCDLYWLQSKCLLLHQNAPELNYSQYCLKMGEFYLIPKTWVFQVIRVFARSFSDVQLFMSPPSAQQYLMIK